MTVEFHPYSEIVKDLFFRNQFHIQGMPHDKTGSLRVVLVNPDITAHHGDCQFTNSQSEPCTLHVFIQFFKTLEHLLLLLFRDTATGIRHAEINTIFFLVNLES